MKHLQFYSVVKEVKGVTVMQVGLLNKMVFLLFLFSFIGISLPGLGKEKDGKSKRQERKDERVKKKEAKAKRLSAL